MEEHQHNAKFGMRKQLFLVAALVAVALLIITTSSSFGKPFLSPEVKFTDLAKGGLQIVPASCPSDPNPGEDCSTGPVTPPSTGGCSLTASQYDVQPGESLTLYWAETIYPAEYATGGNPTLTITVSGGSIDQTVYDGPVWQGTPDWSGTASFSGSIQVNGGANTEEDIYTLAGSLNGGGIPQCYAAITASQTFCPDGSPAPGANPSQCTCAQGNQAACNNNNGGCPTGSSFENGQCVEACQGSGEFGGGQDTSCSCPSGFTAENGECVWNNCPTGYTEQNGQCSFTGCPTGYTEQNGQCVSSPACSAGYICESGNQYYENASCTVSSSPTQTCNYGCFSGACLAPPSPELATWSVVPALLKSGETTNVSWQAENVTSCSVTGSNGDSWSGLSGNETSSAITGQTIYTITCQGLAGVTPSSVSTSTTVNIVPTYQEI